MENQTNQATEFTVPTSAVQPATPIEQAQANQAFDAAFAPQPQQAQQEASSSTSSTQSSQDSNNGIIDLADPRLQQATVEYDPTADANAYKPLPDGDWICTIELDPTGKNGDIYIKETDKSGFYIVAAIKATVSDPSAGVFDGTILNTDWVNSIMQQKTGTSSLVHLLNCLGRPAPRGLKITELLTYAKQVLSSGLKCKVRTKWEARSQEAQELYEAGDTKEGRKNGILKTGMKSFPQNDKNEYVPYVQCPVTGEDKAARPKTQLYLALK